MLCLSGLSAFALMAGTYRVNNKLAENPSAKIYSEIQAAHDAAYNGDTLMIEASSQGYWGFTCTKKLVIKGPGYYLDENPGISANKLSASIFSQTTFNSGSDGSLMMGLEINADLVIFVDNMTVRRCTLHGTYLGSGQNVTFTECFVPESTGYSVSGGVITNLVVSNNIIGAPFSLTEGTTGAILNNVFITNTFRVKAGIDIKNNILFTTEKANVELPLLPDPDVSYNISISDHFGTDNHNQANVSESTLFLGSLTESTDGKWQLAAGSPAAGAGEGGVDCGAFGGPQPYILSGLPAGPVIYELNVSSFSTEDNKLPVSIKVKSY